MNKRLLALILVFLMCLSVIPLPNELGIQAKSFSDSDGDGFDDSVDPCPDSQYEWSLTEVDSNPKAGYSSTSLVVDENDRPHIAYHDGTDKDLQYALYDGNSWNKKELESTGDTGYAVSMALNSNDDPLVAYVDNTGGVMTSTLKLYNVSSDEIFSYNNVYSGDIYQATGFTINDQDAPILTYRVEHNFEWLEFNSDGTVNGGTGQNLGSTNSYYVAVTSDSLGNQPVAWQSAENPPNGPLLYKTDISLPSSQETVISNDRGPGGFISLTTDHNDNPHMIYRVEQDTRLQYSYSTDLGSTWSHEIIESVSNVPYYSTSIKIDSQNNPHIVYSAYQEVGFRYAYRNSTGWDITELNGIDDSLNIQGGGNWLSMDLDSYDSPHISFHDTGSNSLKYAILDKADSDNDGCLDGEDAFPGDAYEQFDDDGNGVGDNEDYSGRIYSINPLNGTQLGGTEVTITGSGFESLLNDGTVVEDSNLFENDTSLLGHWDFNEDVNGSWIHTTPGGLGEQTGQWSSIGLGTNGIHVAHTKTDSIDLMYSYSDFGSNSWSTTVVDEAGSVGEYSSIAVDSNDQVHISYQDGTNLNLKYAFFDGSSWTTSTVDSSDNVGQYSSMVIDSNDDAHIVYWDDTNSNLKYAQSNGASWTISVVEPDCVWPSIALDANDNKHISCFDLSNYTLKYLYHDGVSWSSTTVDSTNQVGRYSSIAIDSNGEVHISYQDQTNNDLRYAYFDGNTWSILVVDSTGVVGEFTSIAIDSKDVIHISYADDTLAGTSNLKYARLDSNCCSGNITWKVNEYFGEFTSIAIDALDQVYVSSRGAGVLHVYVLYKDKSNGEHFDSSSKGYHGVCDSTDTCPSRTVGADGWALDFDGANDYINLDDSGADFSGLSEITVAAWIKWSGDMGGTDTQIFMAHDEAWYLGVRGTNNGATSYGYPSIWFANHGGDGYILDSTTITTEWTHVAATWFEDTKESCVFINGQLSSCNIQNSNGDGMDSSANAAFFGVQRLPSPNHFEGGLDDAWIFERGLNSSEIADFHSSLISAENDSEPLNSTLPLQARLSTDDWNATVILTYVDNNTLTLTTPPGPETQTVNLTLIGAAGQELLLLDAYTFDSSAIDSDGDGFLDNLDDCPNFAGNSTTDRIGCLDSDGDGYSDIDGSSVFQDKFSFDATQWSDYDDDGYGDNYGNSSWQSSRPSSWPGVFIEGAITQDACPGFAGNSTGVEIYGCLDTDGDSYADYIDSFYEDNSQWLDSDGDGYGENSSVNATTPDSCPDIWGNSTFDRYGCLDSDGDGMSDEIDDFPLDAERTSDVDDDGLDDLFDDNCPNTFNPMQEDHDGDGMGDICDTDEDEDGIHDGIDNCPRGIIDWTSGTLLDYDGDGCLDGAEDSDDDGDGVIDGMDGCPKGDFGWQSSPVTDHDSDGCNDESEDLDDDGDGKDDSKDSCPKGANDWSSTTITDRDADGCRDSDEDLDDDGDGINDENDSCPTGLTQWVSDPTSDADADGCHDELDTAPSTESEDETESFIELLTSGNLDAIGILLAVVLPIAGISITLILRKRKTAIIQALGDKIDFSKSDFELESISNDLMMLVAKDSISQAQYDILKFKIEGRRSALHSDAFSAPVSEAPLEIIISPPEVSAIGYDGNDGYEWLDHDDGKWYRTINSGDQWIKWEN